MGNGAQISVGGTLSATSTIFNGYDSSNISVSSGGNLTPTNCTFNLPISVPYTVVPNLAGNVSFEQVNISSATLPGDTTLNLISLGTNTTNFYYIFPNGFNVALDATLAVGANVLVEIPGGQTLTDNGAVSFATGDTFSFVTTAPRSPSAALSLPLPPFSTAMIARTSPSARAETSLPPTARSTCRSSSPITSCQTSRETSASSRSTSTRLPSRATPRSTSSASAPTPPTSIISSRTASTSLSDATLAVGANVLVQIPGGQTLTDNGAVSFATGDTFSFVGNGAQISVGGTLSATSTIFNGYDSSNISVSSGGNLTPTNCTFNLPIFVPYNVVPNLAGNVSFEQVNIGSATLPGDTTLNLISLGTNTTNFYYDFSNGFNVALGATLAVGANVLVEIPGGQTLTDDGAVSFATGDTVFFVGNGHQISVGGTLSAASTISTAMIARTSPSARAETSLPPRAVEPANLRPL